MSYGRKIILLSICLMLLFTMKQHASETPRQPLILQLNWIPNVQFAGVLFAQQRGWYQEAGVDLTVKGWEEGLSTVTEVVSGNAHIGIIEGVELIRAKTENLAIKAFAVDFQKSPFCLMSKQEQRIERPEQLVGKKIGIDSSETELMLRIVLASQGLQFQDITPVPVGWDLQPFIENKVDVYPAYMNDQPLIMKEQGYNVTYLPAFKYGYDFYSGVYIATETLIQQQPDLLLNFIAVTLRGWKEAFRDPAATAQMIIENYYPEGSVQQQTESLKLFRMLATVGEGKKYLGWMEEDAWAKGVDLLYKLEHIDQHVLVQDLLTMEFLENLYFGIQK